MKHVIILGDGMADYPVERLGGRTPLQVANKPHIDRIARDGRTGMLRTLTPDLPTGSAVANLAVLGYDPRACFQGRGVLEAASMGVPIGEDQIALRCNLICTENGHIKNHSAGHISSAEAAELIRALDQQLGGDTLRFHPGVSYRHLLVATGLNPDLACAPPHDHPGEPVEELMIKPRDPAAEATARRLNDLTRQSWSILADHPVNRRRRSAGKDPANSIWLWSPGRKPRMWTFHDRFGIRGAVISAVDLVRGIGVYGGLEIIDVDGATGLWDTNYEGKADACLAALERVDFVYLHVEAPDEAGHEGDLELKIRTIEDIDLRLVGRILEGLERQAIDAVVAILPDHPTPVELRVHVRDPIPFAILDPRQAPDEVQVYDEVSCRSGGYGTLEGDAFIRAVFGQTDEQEPQTP
ncbi:MAG: cofactor-independent phosphoglycerate mutase [candidate division BRC1 bacterium ADurb.BinA292]|nr:MAG: cofactor-independent phosphoglycerate mutase [candidate division BRC1 bacterium ADurb.BinA292]